MLEFLQYLLEATICLAGFYLLYRFGLRRLSHFGWNRFFLLFGLGAVLLLPLAEIPVAWQLGSQEQNVFQAITGMPHAAPVAQPTVRETAVLAEQFVPSQVAPGPALPTAPAPALTTPVLSVSSSLKLKETGSAQGIPWTTYLFILWAIGASAAGARFIFRMLKIRNCYALHPQTTLRGKQVTHLPAGRGTFSFFSWIFLDDAGLSPVERDLVLAHERAHGHLWHSLDNLFLELAACLLWFHPAIYSWRRSLSAVHEYQADAAVATAADPVAYSRLILRLSQPRRQPIPAHAFAQSKAGRRIEMLHHLPSHPMSKLKYLFVLPLLSLFIFAFAIVPAERENPGAAAPSEEFTYEFAGEAIPVDQGDVGEKLSREMEWLKSKNSLAAKAIDRAELWRTTLLAILKEEGIPSDFFYLAMAESMLNTSAQSPIGARGMWQFMPQTARNCGLEVNEQRDQRLNPLRATRAAARFLRELYAETGSWTASASAYNLGLPGYRKFLRTHNAASYFEVKGSKENYLYRIMAFKRLIEMPQAFGQRAIPARDASNPPLAQPLSGRLEVTAGYGLRVDPFSKKKRHHNGIDFRADKGTPVMAPADATVLAVMADDEAHGNRILLRHDGTYTTSYSHLDAILVQEGQKLKAGEVIGKVGSTGRSTGPHLHYEVHEHGQDVDPRRFLREGNTAPWNEEGFLRTMPNERKSFRSRGNNVAQSGDDC